MSVLLVFIDGIGLGPRADSNPFHTVETKGFESFSEGQLWTADARAVETPATLFRPIDATLGVEGLPQSGTGQASLFTGINCALHAGRHYGPWPHSSTRDILRTQNVFRQTMEGVHGTALFANAYPDRFFELSARRDRWSTTTRCCLDAGVPILRLDNLAAGKALAADITGAGLQRFEPSVEPVTEEVAARRLAGMASRNHVTVFEYFHSDKAGHSRSEAAAAGVLQSLSRFLGELSRVRPDSLSIVITSDHGNLEDLSVKTHTTNAVPLAVLGPAAPSFRNVHDLTGVTPAIVASLGHTHLGE